MTIVEAIEKVLLDSNRPLTHKEIYGSIIDGGYYCFGAKDPASVVRSKIRKHCFGLDFPSSSPRKIFVESGLSSGKTLYSLWDGKVVNEPLVEKSTKEKTTKEQLPEEIIYIKHNEHVWSIKQQLLDCINASDPAFFEQLVVKLLLKMGYGWHESLAGKVVGGAGDEGIDGIINEDKLGLEKIYIQAKRYKHNKVPSSEIREFVGAMALKGARKGVFFSSSSFTEQALLSATKAQGMNVTLIDGIQLCDLLVQHGMGVAIVDTFEILEVDRNFFDF